MGQTKIQSLLDAGAEVRVVAPHGTATVAEWAQSGAISWDAREFQASDIEWSVFSHRCDKFYGDQRRHSSGIVTTKYYVQLGG